MLLSKVIIDTLTCTMIKSFWTNRILQLGGSKIVPIVSFSWYSWPWVLPSPGVTCFWPTENLNMEGMLSLWLDYKWLSCQHTLSLACSHEASCHVAFPTSSWVLQFSPEELIIAKNHTNELGSFSFLSWPFRWDPDPE